MSHTFEGAKNCVRFHYNSDLSGRVEIETPDATIRIAGANFLAFFRHLQEMGGALAEKLHAMEREVGAPTIQVPVKTRQEPDGQWLAYWMAPEELQPEDCMTGRGKTEQEALIELQAEMSWEDGKLPNKPHTRIKECIKCGYNGTWRLEWCLRYLVDLSGTSETLQATCRECGYRETWPTMDATSMPQS